MWKNQYAVMLSVLAQVNGEVLVTLVAPLMEDPDTLKLRGCTVVVLA